MYLGCSALALALDMALYSFALFMHAPLALAAALGFSAGLMLIYFFSTCWVFTEHRVSDRRQEFLIFAGIGLAGLLLTEMLIWILASQLHLSPHEAKLISACAVFFFNFGARKALLFSRRTSRTTYA